MYNNSSPSRRKSHSLSMTREARRSGSASVAWWAYAAINRGVWSGLSHHDVWKQRTWRKPPAKIRTPL